jgi:protein TonB
LTRRRISLVIRFGGRGSAFSPFMVGSLMVHLFATAALAILPALHPRPAPIGDAWVVGLASALPAAAAPAGGAASVQPSSPAPAPEPSSAVRLDAPKPKEKQKESKKKKDQPEAKPVGPLPPAGPAQRTGPVLPGGAVGTQGAAGPGIGAAGGTGVFSMDLADAQLAWYRATVVASLQSRWIRPVLDGVSSTLSVTVTFDVDRDGSIRNVRVETSSGVPSLDRSALRAVEEASPLPPVPPGGGQPPFAARFEFRWSPGNP